MEQAGCTPSDKCEDSGYTSHEASYCLSSTPLSHNSHYGIGGGATTSGGVPRKRKRSIPQFSSTLDESLIKNINKIDLDRRYSSGFHSLPTVDESDCDLTPCKCNRIASSTVVESPVDQICQILHPGLTKVSQKSTPKEIDRCDHAIRSDFISLINNPIILNKISENLSDGALHRFSQASGSCKQVLLDNPSTSSRVGAYRGFYKANKENITVSPPSSPENSGNSSPDTSDKFKAFVENGKTLQPNERQTPCLKCGQPSVVRNDVAQCTRYCCGAIMCLRCWSCSMTGPGDFKDRCGASRLILVDLSNKSPQRLSNSSDKTARYVRRGLLTVKNHLAGVQSDKKRVRKRVNLAKVVAIDRETSSEGSLSPPTPPKRVTYSKRKHALRRLCF